SENGGWAGLDYFGNSLKVGTIAVDPKMIPLGTKLYVTGYDYNGLPQGGMIATATDIGGSIKGNRIDIFVPDSQSKAMKFGIQQVKIYILE
ncbi:3D domain-containing protein, partial [Paenibacillus sp. MCAF20]